MSIAVQYLLDSLLPPQFEWCCDFQLQKLQLQFELPLEELQSMSSWGLSISMQFAAVRDDTLQN